MSTLYPEHNIVLETDCSLFAYIMCVCVCVCVSVGELTSWPAVLPILALLAVCSALCLLSLSREREEGPTWQGDLPSSFQSHSRKFPYNSGIDGALSS